MKPLLILALSIGFLAGLIVVLPTRETEAESEGMSTITKAKKPARRAPARATAAPKAYRFTPRTPPASKTTAAALLKIKNFGEGVDGELVESIVADRARW